MGRGRLTIDILHNSVLVLKFRNSIRNFPQTFLADLTFNLQLQILLPITFNHHLIQT
jgi:hypothetical protein